MSPTSNNHGIVYLLTDPAMPGLVKIGMTTRDCVEERMKELYGTCIPAPFDCDCAKPYSHLIHKRETTLIAMNYATSFKPYRVLHTQYKYYLNNK